MDTRTLLNHGYRYGLSLTHDSASAEDLLQEAWARVLRAEGPHTKAYLYATMRNVFIDQKRRDKVVQFVPTDIPEEIAGAPPDAEDRAARRHYLERVLGTLEPHEREILYLNAVEGYSTREIGEMSDRPRNTVLSLMHRARRKVLAAFGAEAADEEVMP